MDKILAPIKQRILQVIDYKQVERIKFFKNLNIAASNFRGNGVYSEVGGEVIAKILAEFPEINSEWLLTGQGKMLKNEVQKEVSAPITGQNVGVLEQENAFLKRENELLQGQIKDKNKIITTLESNQKLLQEKISAYEKSTHYATASQSITRPTL